MKDAVVFILYNKEARQVLVEQRLPDSHYAPNEIVFPGGKHDPNKDTSIEDTFTRELGEETGIIPLTVITLMALEYPEKDIRLHPFVVTEWTGEVPKEAIDKKNPLFQVSIESMATSSRHEVATIAQAILSLFPPQGR